ncbi:hypothetical protein AB5J62_22515 [Amycolatopsis sp. cg5]|uniref:DUF7507 domain-containing protein n=1 Tax=Amycolatopsis sp. cg5 TaxID=3238802 RepID=UPI003525273C
MIQHLVRLIASAVLVFALAPPFETVVNGDFLYTDGSAPVTIPAGTRVTQARLTGSCAETATFTWQGGTSSARPDQLALIDHLPRGIPMTVTVGNDWAAFGSMCTGWSLILGYESGEPRDRPSLALGLTTDGLPVRPGAAVPITIDVTNTGADLDLREVTVSQLGGTACAPAPIGDLAPGAHAPASCTVTAGQADFAVTLKVTGTAADGTTATIAATTAIRVIHPDLSVTITPKADPVGPAAPIAFTVTVSNDSTDTKLTDLVVTTPDTPCAAPPTTLEPGARSTYECQVTPPGGAGTHTTTVTATGTADDRKPVGSTASATVHIDAPKPALRITKTSDTPKTTAGGLVTFTVEIENTGNVPLTVEVTDASAPDCGISVPAPGLAIGGHRQQSCTVTPAVIGTLSNVATFTARGPGATGEPLTGTSETVEVAVDPPASTTSGASESSSGASSPAPEDSGGQGGALASTGFSVADPVLAGFGLLLSGSLLCLASRRR